MQTTSDEHLLFTKIESLSDAQVMRQIRNDCREYMTKSTVYISEENQKNWFNNLDQDKIKMFLMWNVHHGVIFEIMGFGYCRNVDDETYLTGGILENYRNKGYGKKLFSHLLEEAKSFNTKITLEVLNSNARAEKVYRSIGFVPVYKDDRIMKMEYKNDSTL